MAVYRKRSYNNAFRKAGRFAIAAAQAYKRSRSYTKTQNSKKVTAGVGITRQHDAQVVYRKRYMPKYKKRPWAKFVKKVKAVQLSSLGKRTFVLNDTDTLANVANQQTWNLHLLYGKNGDTTGTSSYGIADLRRVTDSFAGTSLATTNNNYKIQFHSAILDITIQNSDATAIVECDVYHVKFWKSPPDLRPSSSVGKAENATSTGTLGSSLELTDRGVTPFDLPMFLSNTGCKILKKTKYFIAPTDCVTYQIRDARNRTITRMEVCDYGASVDSTTSTSTTYLMPGWTQGVLVIHKPAPVSAGSVVTLKIGVTRKYLCSQIQDNYYTDYN